MTEVWVEIGGYPDSDLRERAELAWDLKAALRGLDVEDVSRPVAQPPVGAKGPALEWAQLGVTLVGALPPFVTAVRGWLRRHPGASITLEIDGDKLTLSEPSDSERQALIAGWMKRHGV